MFIILNSMIWCCCLIDKIKKYIYYFLCLLQFCLIRTEGLNHQPFYTLLTILWDIFFPCMDFPINSASKSIYFFTSGSATVLRIVRSYIDSYMDSLYREEHNAFIYTLDIEITLLFLLTCTTAILNLIWSNPNARKVITCYFDGPLL